MALGQEVISSFGNNTRDYWCTGGGSTYAHLQAALLAWRNASPTDFFGAARSGFNAAGGATNNIVLDGAANASNGFYNGYVVWVNSRPTEKRLITGYDGASKTATIGALNGSSATWTAPSAGEAYTIDGICYVAEIYDDIAEYDLSAGFTLPSGRTLDAEHFFIIRAAPSSSHKVKQTGASNYDTTRGTAIKIGDGLQIDLSTNTPRVLVTGLQLRPYNTGNLPILCGSNAHLYENIIQIERTGTFSVAIGTSGEFVNNVVIWNTTAGNATNCYAIDNNGTGTARKIVGNTLVVPSNVTPVSSLKAINNSGVAQIAQNNNIFGFPSIGSTLNSSSSNNASDLAIGYGTNNRASITNWTTTVFENSSTTSLDLRPKNGGSELVGYGTETVTSISGRTGTAQTTNPTDLRGATRATSPSSPTIGALENRAGSASNLRVLMTMYQ